MSSEDSDFIDEDVSAAARPKKKMAGEGGGKKRLSVERIYQKKSQLEHILIRPDTYIGSVEFVTQNMWVYDGEEIGMVHREVSFVPGLYKIFDEILVNAADNKVRDKKMDCIKVTIDPEQNMVKIWNNGQGIPVVEHKDEKMYVPTLIFGHLLTSSNYNDEEQKVTGGRNGYGAKLCNVFSKKFVVETATKANKKCFKQVWTENMSKKTEPRIDYYSSSEDYTCITFYPDLERFKMEKLDKDIVALMSKRAYDIAGTTKGVKVYLNSKKLPIRGFKEYVEQYLKDKEDDTGNPLKCVYEAAGERWEVALSLSIDKGFQQVSFVNSIATFKGGRHVDYVNDQIVSKIIEQVKKKNKGGVQVKPFQIKSHIWLFVNCQIVNPTFDSQTKENMTLQTKSFGSKCILSDKFMAQVLKSGVVESVLNWVKFKTETQLNKKCSASKKSKLKGVPKLEDANDAGTKNSINCTLILTEGDSAKTLAVSGLSVVGRDVYGVFPLRGKMLNVREATQKQILENAEINNIIKIMGLQYKMKYETVDDLKKLRYGKLMIMTDQDQDGSHIKGLLINFIHHNWPSLLKLPFLEEFITPIVKAFKGNQELKFYSMPEFEEWKTQAADWNKWRVKYYKGLGTSTAKEAREYFADMVRHRIKFRYKGTEDDNAIQLAFSKKMIEQRKEWLTNGMQERKQRRELGLPEIYVYGKTTTAITYSDFVNKELILFSNTDNERSIPSMVDGLKPGQRKVIFTCIKRKDKKEVKVAQLAGSVAEHSAYHHGEQSLMGTIITLAQNFVGSHNINLLMPIGQFGTRLQGGKDAASPRYIFTKLSPLAKLIINQLDQPLLNHLRDDSQIIEPEYYIPIIPMVLVNGAEGIGTGWSTKIPNYNPRDIVNNLRRLLRGEEPIPMKPWYKNFRGTIEAIDASHFVASGEVAVLGPSTIEITELPIKTWTQPYKESVLEAMVHGSEKTPAQISNYKEYTTDTTVRFVVSMSENSLSQYEEKGLHKIFKLQSPISINSMVLFDSNGVLKRYDSPEEILREFYTLRLEFYVKRKNYLEGMLEAQARKLTNQARFILEKIDGTIVLEDKKKKTIIDKLIERKYDSDPVKAWNETQKENLGEDTIEKSTGSGEESDSDGEAAEGKDFDYLLQMSLMSLSRERKDKLLEEKGAKVSELEKLRKKSPSDLWTDDLDLFMEELTKTEAQEKIDDKVGMKGSDKMGKGKNAMNVKDTLPSNRGQRIVPFIDEQTRIKVEKAIEVKKKKKAGIKTETENGDDEDSDTPLPLSERIGTSPAELEKKAGGNKKGLKQSKISFKTAPKKEPSKKKSPPKKKKNEWSGSESGSDNNMDISYTSDRPISTPPPPRRAAQANKKYTYSDSGDDLEDLEPKMSPSPPPPRPKTKAKRVLEDSEGEEKEPEPPKNVNGVTAVFPSTVSSDSDSSDTKKLKGAGNSVPKPPDTNALFDSLLGDKSDEKENTIEIDDTPAVPSVRPIVKAPAPKVVSDSDDVISPSPPPTKKTSSKAKRGRTSYSEDSSEDDFVPKRKTTAPSKKPVTKRPAASKPKKQAKAALSSDDDVLNISDDESPKKMQFDAPPRARQARAKAPIKYSFDDDESSGEDF